MFINQLIISLAMLVFQILVTHILCLFYPGAVRVLQERLGATAAAEAQGGGGGAADNGG